MKNDHRSSGGFLLRHIVYRPILCAWEYMLFRSCYDEENIKNIPK